MRKRKKKTGLSDGESVRFAVGDKFEIIKNALPKENANTPLFDKKHNSIESILPDLVSVFDDFPQNTTAADGNTVYLKREENGRKSNRLLHLIANEDKNNKTRNYFEYETKIKWLPRVVETLENAQAKIRDPQSGNFAYIRAYSEGMVHAVLVTKNNVFEDSAVFDHGLITQFADRFTKNKRDGFDVVWEKSTASISNAASSQTESSREISRPFGQEEYTLSLKNFKPDTKKNTRFSVAPDIDTPAFKNWFADSKVVDQDGKPLVVYHGTDNAFGFTEFKPGEGGEEYPGGSIFFVDRLDVAETYSGADGVTTLKENSHEGNYAVYLNIRNPLVVDGAGASNKRLLSPPGSHIKYWNTNQYAEYAKDNGYDGVIFKNIEDVGLHWKWDTSGRFPVAITPEGPCNVYVVFSSNQIKSATDNIGTFDVNNPDIRYSVSQDMSEWEKAVISVLRPVVGESVEMDKAEIAAKVKELYGLDLSPDDANLYAYLAAAENRHDNASRQIAANKKRAFEHLEDVNTYFYFFRQSGENQTINPGKEYEGNEATGSFISEGFRKYSAKRPQNKNESDKSYRRYLERRRKKLDDADGIDLTDLAESYTRMYGGDPKTVAAKHFYATISLPTREAPPCFIPQTA